MSHLPSHYLGMLCLTVVVIEDPILKTLCYLAIRPTCANWRSQRATSPGSWDEAMPQRRR